MRGEARALGRVAYRPTPAMNVTPLVDVVLVLLIIFMVVVPMMEKSARVELPSIFNVDPEAKGKTNPFTLSLTKEGDVYFENERLDTDRFRARLMEAQQREPTRRLILRADRSGPYAQVRKLFKACQEIGFPGISLRVEERREARTETLHGDGPR
jgi:biopolymer transport protein ExbD/biopolymer transport protein TolR